MARPRLQDARAQGRAVALVLLTVSLGGCSSGRTAPNASAAPAAPFEGVKLVVAAVGDPAILATVTPQRGEWMASRGGEVAVLDKAAEPSAGGIDIFLFPGERLGDLVDAGALAILPEAAVQPPPRPEGEPGGASEDRAAPEESSADHDDPLRFGDVLPAYRDQVSKYGVARMALPYGGSALVLAYTRAAFEGEANRDAARQAGVKLEPPATWGEFDTLARVFQGRDWDGDGTPDFGIALALGPDPEGVGDATFLARAASLGQHRDQYSFLFDADTMTPRIGSPPFVEALRGLAALKDCGPPGLSAFDAEAARRAFRQGKVAMLIDRAERASGWGNGKAIGAAPLPGSTRVYEPGRKLWETEVKPNRPSYLPSGGGWLVGVARSLSGRRREAAIDFAKYLIAPEVSARVRADRAFPMVPVRSSQLLQGLPDPRAAQGVNSKQWSDAVSRTLAGERVVPGLRIPQASRYLAELAQEREDVMEGEPAESALANVAKLWSARTKDLGLERQLWHYRRGLNSMATLPEPPER